MNSKMNNPICPVCKKEIKGREPAVEITVGEMGLFAIYEPQYYHKDHVQIVLPSYIDNEVLTVDGEEIPK